MAGYTSPNPYMGYNYQSPYQSPYYQSYQPPMPIVPPVQIPNTNQAPAQSQSPSLTPANPAAIIWVNGERQALEYPVAANSAVALWDSANPVIYLKQADSSGKPSTKIFDLVERVEKPQNDSGASQVDISAFASKNDLAAISGVVGSLSKDIDALKDEMANLASQAVKRAVGAKSKKEPAQEDEN